MFRPSYQPSEGEFLSIAQGNGVVAVIGCKHGVAP